MVGEELAQYRPATDRSIVPGIPGQASSEEKSCRARRRVCKSQRFVRKSAHSTEQDAKDMGDVPFFPDATTNSDLHTAYL